MNTTIKTVKIPRLSMSNIVVQFYWLIQLVY